MFNHLSPIKLYLKIHKNKNNKKSRIDSNKRNPIQLKI